MVNKYQLITKLYRTMLVSVTEMPQSQKAFLRSACNNYKCPFDEQVLICAQKPDATAVFEMEKWNTLLKLPLPKVLKTTSGHLPKRNPFRRQQHNRNDHSLRLRLFGICGLGIQQYLWRCSRSWRRSQKPVQLLQKNKLGGGTARGFGVLSRFRPCWNCGRL